MRVPGVKLNSVRSLLMSRQVVQCATGKEVHMALCQKGSLQVHTNWPFDGHLAKSQPGGSCQSPLCLQITIGWTSAGQKFLMVMQVFFIIITEFLLDLRRACCTLG